MIINRKFFSVAQFGQEALQRQLAIDEANLTAYERPTMRIKATKWHMTKTALSAFAREVYREYKSFLKP